MHYINFRITSLQLNRERQNFCTIIINTEVSSHIMKFMTANFKPVRIEETFPTLKFCTYVLSPQSEEFLRDRIWIRYQYYTKLSISIDSIITSLKKVPGTMPLVGIDFAFHCFHYYIHVPVYYMYTSILHVYRYITCIPLSCNNQELSKYLTLN
jgi:hypothetical protein